MQDQLLHTGAYLGPLVLPDSVRKKKLQLKLLWRLFTHKGFLKKLTKLDPYH